MSSFLARRHTLAAEATFEGVGLHGGEPVKLRIHPSDGGIVFRHGTDRIPAIAESVTDTTRSTTLGPVHTVEHLMSALAALEITDVEIEVEGNEMPGLDGSSGPFYEGLSSVGTLDIGEHTVYAPFKRVFHQDGALSLGAAAGTGHWRYDYDLGDRWPGKQSFEVHNVVAEYEAQISRARTFALAEEIPHILKMGLAKGLNEDSALILGIEGYKNEPRFLDEPARHKLLDLCGDLYLSGLPLRSLNVVAIKSGHKSNVQLALLLRKWATVGEGADSA